MMAPPQVRGLREIKNLKALQGEPQGLHESGAPVRPDALSSFPAETD